MERRPYDEYDFRRHFDKAYADSDRDFTEMEPAYRYGYRLAGEQDRDWSEIEEEARTRWMSEQPGLDWDTCIVAIRYGYDRSRAGDSFRRHFEESYPETGKEWATTGPAYDYGYELAQHEAHLDRPWEDVEKDARKGWLRGYAHEEADWEMARGAMAYGYERGQMDYSGTGKGWLTGYSDN